MATDLNKNEIAAYLLHGLAREFQKNEAYWGGLGNACLALGFTDRALVSYRRAEVANEPTPASQWILSNIGNALNNKELPSEAKTYLERAVKLGPSDYAYERLAIAMKKSDAELKEFEKKSADGLKQIRAMNTLVEISS